MALLVCSVQAVFGCVGRIKSSKEGGRGRSVAGRTDRRAWWLTDAGVQLLQLSVEECCADRSRGSAHHGLGGLQTSAQRLELVRGILSRCLGRHIGHE